MLSSCWLFFLHSAVRLIPNHFNLSVVGGLWRSGHLMQHSIILLLGHCPFEKQMIAPLRANQVGWRITAECCGSHAG